MSAVPGCSTRQGKLPGKLKGKFVNIKSSLFFISKSEEKKADHVFFCISHINTSVGIGTKNIIEGGANEGGQSYVFLNKITSRK